MKNPITLLPLFLLTACATTSSVPGEIALTQSDSGKTISAAPNQTLSIDLDSNVTTGFKWNLVSEPDGRVLKLVSSKYLEPNNPIPGKGGSENWKFQAVAAGTSSVKLQYFRPFDPKQIAAEFTITVTVK